MKDETPIVFESDQMVQQSLSDVNQLKVQDDGKSQEINYRYLADFEKHFQDLQKDYWNIVNSVCGKKTSLLVALSKDEQKPRGYGSPQKSVVNTKTSYMCHQLEGEGVKMMGNDIMMDACKPIDEKKELFPKIEDKEYNDFNTLLRKLKDQLRKLENAANNAKSLDQVELLLNDSLKLYGIRMDQVAKKFQPPAGQPNLKKAAVASKSMSLKAKSSGIEELQTSILRFNKSLQRKARIFNIQQSNAFKADFADSASNNFNWEAFQNPGERKKKRMCGDH